MNIAQYYYGNGKDSILDLPLWFQGYVLKDISQTFTLNCILNHALCVSHGTSPFWGSTGGFPHSSVSKESAFNAGNPGSIPGSGRSTGEGIGYSLQYSWASLVAQLVKNPPAMRETWVQSLGWEDPLEKGKATQLQYSGLANSMDYIVHGVTKSRTRLSNFHFHFLSGTWNSSSLLSTQTFNNLL